MEFDGRNTMTEHVNRLELDSDNGEMLEVL